METDSNLNNYMINEAKKAIKDNIKEVVRYSFRDVISKAVEERVDFAEFVNELCHTLITELRADEEFKTNILQEARIEFRTQLSAAIQTQARRAVGVATNGIFGEIRETLREATQTAIRDATQEMKGDIVSGARTYRPGEKS